MSASMSSRLAVALDAGDADDLAAVDGEATRRRAACAPSVDDGEPCDVELDLVGDGRLARARASGSSLPTISSASSRAVTSVGVDRGDGAAGADHGDRVGDREHLVELVRDEDDRDALARELAQRSSKSSATSCGTSTAVGSSRIRMRAPR